MTIHILGNRGMLGSYMESFLSERYPCVGYNRQQFDVIEDINNLDKIKLRPVDVVINCIGTIKPQIESTGETNSFVVNSLFPRLLAHYCHDQEATMFHVTTDCVYSGAKGEYKEDDPADQLDTYGLSKHLGEPHNCCVIRTSIIGEEKHSARSLVEWVKSQKDGDVFGFTNHFWNGVTCLELAKCIHKIIESDQSWYGTRHIFTPSRYSKLEMLQMLNDSFGLNLAITPKEADFACDRTLNSIYDTSESLGIETLENQIGEMALYD